VIIAVEFIARHYSTHGNPGTPRFSISLVAQPNPQLAKFQKGGSDAMIVTQEA